jgi:hypothetical protein
VIPVFWESIFGGGGSCRVFRQTLQLNWYLLFCETFFFFYNLNQQSKFTFYKLMWLLQCLDGESSSGESPVPVKFLPVTTSIHIATVELSAVSMLKWTNRACLVSDRSDGLVAPCSGPTGRPALRTSGHSVKTLCGANPKRAWPSRPVSGRIIYGLNEHEDQSRMPKIIKKYSYGIHAFSNTFLFNWPRCVAD